MSAQQYRPKGLGPVLRGAATVHGIPIRRHVWRPTWSGRASSSVPGPTKKKKKKISKMNLELFKIQTQSVKRKTQCQMENARLRRRFPNYRRKTGLIVRIAIMGS
jgi:hypothetical protein